MLNPCPLSSNEYGLLELIQLAPDNSSHHLGRAFFVTKGKIDIVLLQITMIKLIQRHPNLRARYQFSAEGHPAQKKILSVAQTLIPVSEKSLKAGEVLATVISELLQQTYNPLTDQPIRFVVVKGQDGHQLALVTTINHLVGDGVSAYIIYKQLEAIYNFASKLWLMNLLFYSATGHPAVYQAAACVAGVFLPSFKPYSDFAAKQQKDLLDTTHPARSFYSKLLDDGAQIEYVLPQRVERNVENPCVISSHTLAIPEDLNAAMAHLAELTGASAARIMLASFHLMLYSMNDRKGTALLRTPHANRSDYGIGYYAHDKTSYVQIVPGMSFTALLEAIKNNFNAQKQADDKGRSSQDLPASSILRALGASLPRVEFNYLDAAFTLNLRNVVLKSHGGGLQADGIAQTWYGKDIYEIELSLYINRNSETGVYTLQVMTANRCYPAEFSKEVAGCYLDMLRKVYHAVAIQKRETVDEILESSSAAQITVPQRQTTARSVNRSSYWYHHPAVIATAAGVVAAAAGVVAMNL